MFYFRLCCELGELDTLNSAIGWIKSDRARHGLGNIVEDLGPLVETMYIHALYARHAALTMAAADEMEGEEDAMRMVVVHGDEMVSILSRCFHLYVLTYSREAAPSRHFASMVSAMDASIANDEIGWFFPFRHEVANLSEVSLEMFLCRASYEYVDLVSDCGALRALMSSVLETPADRLTSMPLSQRGLVVAVMDRAFEVSHDVYLSLSENASAGEGAKEEAQELLLTCKMLRDVYVGRLADLFTGGHVAGGDDPQQPPELSRVEELLVRAYSLCTGQHADRISFRPSMATVLSFCDGLLQRQRPAAANAAAADAQPGGSKRTLQDANDSEPSANENEGDRFAKRGKPGGEQAERPRRAAERP